MQVFTIDRLDRGANSLAPPGLLATQQEGPFWRSLVNMTPRDGALCRREGTVAAADQLSFDDDRDRQIMLWAELAVEPDGGSRYLCVTSREVFVGDQFNGWMDVTPIHTVGTVAITNGTKALTGTTTNWLASAIGPGQLVQLPATTGNWYKIDTVNSDTSITLVETYTGTTLSGAFYVIRRQFLGPEFSGSAPFFYATLNGDVYLAGPVSTGYLLGFGSFLVPDGGVLKIAGAATPLSTPLTAANTQILLSGERAVDGADTLGYNIGFVAGLAFLPDGRLIMPIKWLDASIPTGGGNRVLYSDHQSLALWTTGSGGFVDIIDLDGEVSAVSQIQRDYLIHMANGGIEVAEFTGQSERPLSLYRTSSDVGAVGPRARIDARGSSYFLGQDFQLRVFAGQSSQVLTTYPRFDLADQIANDDIDLIQISNGFMAYFSARDELRFFFRPDSSKTITRELRVSLEDGAYSVHEYGRVVTAAAESLRDDGNLNVIRNKRPTDVGILGTSRLVSGSPADMIYRLDETVTTDAMVLGSARIPQAETDDLGFGDLAGFKIIPDVALSYISASSATLTCVVIRDGSVSETLTVSLAATSGKEQQVFIQGNEGLSARLYRLRFQAPSGGAALVPKLTKLQIWAENVGDVRAAT